MRPITVYAGVDDSNHQTVKHESEFIVAVFSFNPLDACAPPHQNPHEKRNAEDILRLIHAKDMHYRATFLPQEQKICKTLRKKVPGNLAYATSYLINAYFQAKNIEPDSTRLHLCIDGEPPGHDRSYILKDLEERLRLKGIEMHTYPKGKGGREFCYPLILYAADIYAHMMYRAFTGDRIDKERADAITQLIKPSFVQVPLIPYGKFLAIERA